MRAATRDVVRRGNMVTSGMTGRGVRQVAMDVTERFCRAIIGDGRRDSPGSGGESGAGDGPEAGSALVLHKRRTFLCRHDPPSPPVCHACAASRAACLHRHSFEDGVHLSAKSCGEPDSVEHVVGIGRHARQLLGIVLPGDDSSFNPPDQGLQASTAKDPKAMPDLLQITCKVRTVR